MITRASTLGLALCLAFASTGFFSAACAQTPERAQRGNPDWQHPTTEWGHPDIQGNWSNATLTTFERRRGLGPVFTQAQVDEVEGGQRSQVETGSDPSDPDRAPPPVTGAIGRSYNQIYYDRGERVARIDGEGGQRQVETGSDPSDPDRAPPPVTGAIGRSYNQIYYDRGEPHHLHLPGKRPNSRAYTGRREAEAGVP